MNMTMTGAFGVADKTKGLRKIGEVITMRSNELGSNTPPVLQHCPLTNELCVCYESNSFCCAKPTTPAVTGGRRHVVEIVSEVLGVWAARLLVGLGAAKVR